MRPFDPRLLREVPATRTPIVLLGVLGALSGAAAIASAFAIAWLVVAAVRGQSITAAGITVAAVFSLRGLLAAATEQGAAWAATRVSGVLRRSYLSWMLAAPVERRPASERVVTVATQGADSVEPYVARYLPALVSAAVVPPLALASLLVVDWTSAVIVILTLPLLPVFAALIGRATQEATQRRWKTQTRLAGHFLDVMRGLPTLVSYGRADHQADQVAEVGEKHRVATVRTLRIAFLSSAALELLATISVAIVAVWSGMRLAWGQLDLQVALTAILLAPEAYWPIRRVGQEFHAAADGVEAIEELLPGLEPVSAGASTGEGTRLETSVDYTYPHTETPVLQGIPLEVHPGLTAVTGPSGSGKTTLLEILAGLRTPTAGERPPITTHFVTQTPFLAPLSVRDNVELGADADLNAALAVTGFGDVIGELPDGLDTMLGDDGFGLSAGQRARLVLTRALRSDADVVLLDEPTAHLDPLAAAQVRSVVRHLAARKPVVVVTHDDALAAAADRELVIGR
ncbi:thiol reductant ABC exporter subunit CydD [Calidifontibacter terrae]